MSEAKNMTDRRVQRTRRSIRKAFEELISKKNINDISVTEIAELADINRNTFYMHYAGLYELIDEVDNELLAEFSKSFETLDLKKKYDDPKQVFNNIIELIEGNTKFYRDFFSQDKDLRFLKKISLILKTKFRNKLVTDGRIENKKIDILLDYSVAGMYMCYQNWFTSNKEMPIDELIRILMTICLYGAEGLAR